jgi:PIN domain nuclease of toxin-antitoxin system
MVLDTCAVLWTAFDRDKFSAGTLQAIDESEGLIINTLSFWEIGVKVRKKKLSIPIKVTELIHLYVSNERVTIIAPETDIIIQALELRWQHNDPVDRFIVATALKFNTSVVTSDIVIKKFYRKTLI